MFDTGLIIFGAGGHGRVVAETAEQAGWTVLGFIDDRVASSALVNSRHRLLGNRDWLSSRSPSECQIALAIGDNYTRSSIASFLDSMRFTAAIIISPTAVVSPTARIGAGTVICPGAIINSMAIIGKGAIINSGAVVEHDTRVGDYAHLSPHSTLGGGAAVGDFTHIGIGCSILPLVSVGSRTILGAGSVVTRRVPDDVVAYGVPARVRRDVNSKTAALRCADVRALERGDHVHN